MATLQRVPTTVVVALWREVYGCSPGSEPAQSCDCVRSSQQHVSEPGLLASLAAVDKGQYRLSHRHSNVMYSKVIYGSSRSKWGILFPRT
jgi:hypothetical protein